MIREHELTEHDIEHIFTVNEYHSGREIKAGDKLVWAFLKVDPEAWELIKILKEQLYTLYEIIDENGGTPKIKYRRNGIL